MTDDVVLVAGRFYRAIASGCESGALAGSYLAGRYSRPEQKTLYLSASITGVDAAMAAHRRPDEARTVLAFDVDASGIFDLRGTEALAAVRQAVGDPFGDWRTVVAEGGTPPSWNIRDWIEGSGAKGLIDPSRQAPGLWHLILFSWNVPGGATVTRCDDM